MSEAKKTPLDQGIILAGVAAAILLVLVLIVFWPSGSSDSVINDNSVRTSMNEYTQKQQDYLDENANKEGVTVTESGLQYRVLKRGESETRPDARDVVSAHYEGRLIDGSIFDSSYQRGAPSDFPLNRVIAGWTEGLQYMAIGDKYEFTIPSELGYGKRGAGDDIPPGATLIFDVELIGVKGKPE